MTAIRTVDLVDRNDRTQADFQRLANNELRLWHWTFSSINENDSAVHHREDTLNFTAEVGVARRVDDVDTRVFQTTEVAFARMVIPRSFSMSLESIMRSATRWLSRNEPDCFRSSSTRVVLP